MNLLHDLVLIEPEEDQTQRGLIHMPEQYRMLTHRGRVIRVGPGWTNDKGHPSPVHAEVGDDVIYAPWGCIGWVTKEGKRLVLTRQENIVARLSGYGVGEVISG